MGCGCVRIHFTEYSAISVQQGYAPEKQRPGQSVVKNTRKHSDKGSPGPGSDLVWKGISTKNRATEQGMFHMESLPLRRLSYKD